MQESQDQFGSRDEEIKFNDRKARFGKHIVLDPNFNQNAHENFWGNNKGQIRVKEMR